MQTKTNTYSLTTAELKLLEVLSTPGSYRHSVTQICNEAQISRYVYYNALKKPGFINALNSMVIDVLRSRIKDVISSAIEFAISNPRCSADRKMLLEMAGIYIPKHIKGLQGTAGGPIEVRLAEQLHEWAK